MSDDFLSRWSRRKHQARKGERMEEPAPPPPPSPSPAIEVPPAPAETQPAAEAPPLPPLESLTTESDFTAFMKPDVDPGMRSQALKTLFSDPQFNVMDGLDVYIDDYSKPDPMPEGWLEKMAQVARLGAFEPPRDEPPEAAVEPEQPAGGADPMASAKDLVPGEDKAENKTEST